MTCVIVKHVMNTGTQTLLELLEHSLRYENVENSNESE